jgi:hypothetical protein
MVVGITYPFFYGLPFTWYNIFTKLYNACSGFPSIGRLLCVGNSLFINLTGVKRIVHFRLWVGLLVWYLLSLQNG